MPSSDLFRRIIHRLRHWRLLVQLAREAGGRHVASLGLFSALASLLDIAGLGIGVSLLLGGSGAGSGFQLPIHWSLQQGLVALVLVMLLRGGLQALIAIGQERLRSGFTDRLRQQLLAMVLHASAVQLEQLGRGELMGFLMADISRSVLALDQGIRTLQALLALTLYVGGVLLVGQSSAVPLLLALGATGTAALLQRSGSWQLGRLQTHLNGALQRTVGDGLHGLKAVRAAAAEAWLLQRFAQDNARFRSMLSQTVQRQALFAAWRDTLVVLVVGIWLIWSRADLAASAIATTLLLAYRTASTLSGVISAQRLCLGSLPGYEELCKRRQLLQPASEQPLGRTIPSTLLSKFENPKEWLALQWSSGSPDLPTEQLRLEVGKLVAIVGPSGSGKTTFLDRICGLLGEENCCWKIESTDGIADLSGVAGSRQLRQLLAYAPQEAVLFEASLRHNMLLGQDHSNKALEPLLEQLGIAHLARRQGGFDDPLPLALDHFSGGEIHRLGLLRAWLRDCPVEVLDEPTAFLDAAAAEQVRLIIAERCKRRLVLVSTHDPALINQAHHLVRLDATNRSLAENQHDGQSVQREKMHG
jgi:ABC-type transport system involved in cytochrome bd biosynthesis fused ATPase/permease subunit